MIVVVHASGTAVTAGALVGAVATAVAIYLLAIKQGVPATAWCSSASASPPMLDALVAYLLTRAELYDAQRADGLAHRQPQRAGLGVRPTARRRARRRSCPSSLVVARQLRALELGDDAAARPRRPARALEAARSLLAGAALAAVATAAAGPVGFVALVAPQIARRLVGGRSLGAGPRRRWSAPLLVRRRRPRRPPAVRPDRAARRRHHRRLGAPYLLWLLARANRSDGLTGG